MEKFLEFLDAQSGQRLFWFGIVFLGFVYLIMQGLSEIFYYIFNNKKN